MNIEYNDFVGFYRNVYPEGYCQHLIEQFDILQESGAGSNRQQSENADRHYKDDHSIFISLKHHSMDMFNERPCVNVFFNGLQECFNDYTTKFSILKREPLRASTMKMQKTGPGGGYHVWHAEQGPDDNSRRTIVYMLYLNSLSENGGGETEFLYQKLRIKPEENLMLLWPGAYTHAHRGNIVLSDEYKYVITGWFYYD